VRVGNMLYAVFGRLSGLNPRQVQLSYSADTGLWHACIWTDDVRNYPATGKTACYALQFATDMAEKGSK
jgi:hypothetical protein